MSKKTPPLAFARPLLPAAENTRDYQRICRALNYLSEKQPRPSLAELAQHMGLSPAHAHRLFVRWAGLTPQGFVAALTLQHARRLLRQGASVLDAALDAGLSGPSRLHDLFLAYESMTPGDYKRRGEGLEMIWGVHPSPFGLCLIVIAPRGLCGIAFADTMRQARGSVLADMRERWPAARFRRADTEVAPFAAQVFAAPRKRTLKLLLIGSSFEIRVWEALLAIPKAHALSYGLLAKSLGAPSAARAVGTAVGRNPLSYLVPCHRVLRSDGQLGGYHWGLQRKRAMIAFESV